MKKYIVTAVTGLLILLMFAVTGYSQGADFNSLKDAFIANQGKIKTFIGRGSMQVSITNDKGSVIKETNSPITIFVRLPDDLKIQIDGEQPMTMVQKKKYISQRIGLKGAVVTQQVTSKTDLAKNFFMRSLDELRGAVNIVDSRTIVEGGKNIYSFVINVPGTVDSSTSPYKIEKAELAFDSDAMLVRYSFLAGSKEVIRITTSYVKKDDIFAPQSFSTMTILQGMTVTNTMTYTGVTLNSQISDKEFEIK